MRRRQFLKIAGAAATMQITARHVLGGPSHTPPSEKINVACTAWAAEGRTTSRACRARTRGLRRRGRPAGGEVF